MHEPTDYILCHYCHEENNKSYARIENAMAFGQCFHLIFVFSFVFLKKKKMLQNECECAVFSVKRHSEMRRANKYPEYSPHNISSAHAAPYIWNFISTHKHTRTPDPIGSRKWCVCVYFSCSIFITQAQARLRAVC